MSRSRWYRTASLLALLSLAAAGAPAVAADAWRGTWQPGDLCTRQAPHRLIVTVEGDKVTGEIVGSFASMGSFRASIDDDGRIVGRGVTNDDLTFKLRGRRQDEIIRGSFLGQYGDERGQCDGNFEVALTSAAAPPASAPAVPTPEADGAAADQAGDQPAAVETPPSPSPVLVVLATTPLIVEPASETEETPPPERSRGEPAPAPVTEATRPARPEPRSVATLPVIPWTSPDAEAPAPAQAENAPAATPEARPAPPKPLAPRLAAAVPGPDADAAAAPPAPGQSIPDTLPRPPAPAPPPAERAEPPGDLDPDTRARLERLDDLLAQGLTKRRQLMEAAGPASPAPPPGELRPPAAAASEAPADRLRQLDALRAQGLITEPEYQLLSRRVLARESAIALAIPAAPAPAPPPPARPKPPADTPEVRFLRQFYNFCMLRIDNLSRIRSLSGRLAWRPMPESYKQAYQPAGARGFDGWIIPRPTGESRLIIHEKRWRDRPANFCTLTVASGPNPDRLAGEIERRFAPKPLEDRKEGRQRLRTYAITLPDIGEVQVGLTHGQDPSRPALGLSIVYQSE